MLLTNWGNPTVAGESTSFFQDTKASYWVNMTALWTSQLIYIFSLTAPLIFPNRNFGE